MTLPEPVARVAAGRPVALAWENEIGGLTFEVGAGPGRCFVKWSPRAPGIDLADEAARMNWAAAFTPVPQVLASGADDSAMWLVTAPLPGRNAVEDRWIAQPRDGRPGHRRGAARPARGAARSPRARSRGWRGSGSTGRSAAGRMAGLT